MSAEMETKDGLLLAPTREILGRVQQLTGRIGRTIGTV